MFTPFQLSQLAAAAWFGPTASHISSIQVHAPAGRAVLAPKYTVSYHTLTGGMVAYAELACPFGAVAQALHAAHAKGTVSFAQYAQGIWAVAQAEQAFTADAPAAELAPLAPLALCPGCGERAEVAVFGLCACEYVRA